MACYGRVDLRSAQHSSLEFNLCDWTIHHPHYTLKPRAGFTPWLSILCSFPRMQVDYDPCSSHLWPSSESWVRVIHVKESFGHKVYIFTAFSLVGLVSEISQEQQGFGGGIRSRTSRSGLDFYKEGKPRNDWQDKQVLLMKSVDYITYHGLNILDFPLDISNVRKTAVFSPEG